MQRLLAREAKTRDIHQRSDKIVEGILKKRGEATCSTDEREEIITNVINDIKPIQEEHMLVQQPIGL